MDEFETSRPRCEDCHAEMTFVLGVGFCPYCQEEELKEELREPETLRHELHAAALNPVEPDKWSVRIHGRDAVASVTTPTRAEAVKYFEDYCAELLRIEMNFYRDFPQATKD